MFLPALMVMERDRREAVKMECRTPDLPRRAAGPAPENLSPPPLPRPIAKRRALQ